VHLKVRLDEAKACVLVMVGVRVDGSKELIALDEGYRESGSPGRTCCAMPPARDARPGARRR
jgi:transposase-like protein